MLLSAFAFAVMGALVKVAGTLAIPILQIIFVRAVISVALCLFDIRRAHVHPLGQNRILLLARGSVGFLALMAVFFAFIHLPYAQATMLQYMHPVFTTLLAFWFLAERPSLATLACITLSLLGLGCMVTPYLQSGTLPGAYLMALLAGLGGAFGSGVAYTLVRKLATSEHPSVIVLYFPMVCLPATLILGVKDFVWLDSTGWLVLLGVGVFTQLGQVSLTRAMRVDSASRATSLSYLQIVFAAALGWLFFSEVPRNSTLLGASLILSGALITARMQPKGLS